MPKGKALISLARARSGKCTTVSPPRADWQIQTPQKKLGHWLTHSLTLSDSDTQNTHWFSSFLLFCPSCWVAPYSFHFPQPRFFPHWINLKTATRMRVKAHLPRTPPRTLFPFVSSLVCSTTNQRAWLFFSLFFCLKLLSLFSFLTEIESFFTLFILSFLDHVFSLSLSLFWSRFVVLLAVGLSWDL